METVRKNPDLPTVIVGIPVVDTVPGECFGAHVEMLVETSRNANCALVSPLNVFPHDAARNVVIQKAIAAKANYVLFIDDDMIVPRDVFEKLLGTMQATEADVVSGHAYRRGYPYTCVWSQKFDIQGREEIHPADASTGRHRIYTTGCACMLINLNRVLNLLDLPLFKMGTEQDGKRVWEDVQFCRDLNEIGGTIYGDADVRCIHVGDRVSIDDQTVTHLRKLYLKAEEKELEIAGV